MKVDDFLEWLDILVQAERNLMVDKGQEYTVSDDDKFKNFKSLAERMHTTPEAIALIYLLKHMDSIRNYVLHGKEASNEPIFGRIMDARNYLALLGGIIKERKNTEETQCV